VQPVAGKKPENSFGDTVNTMEDIIKTENLRYFYRRAEGETPELVLDGIDLRIKKGTFVAVLGHNGSGKSTLAKQFNAVLLPESGKVWVAGMDTTDETLMIEIRRRVGMVFQNPDNQIVSNVVEEDVAFAPENLGIAPEEIRKRVDEALKTVGMYEFREHATHLLSGGQKQRVAIAGALAMGPECMVFDEPTAMLDPQGRKDVIRIIERLSRERGVTVVLITHHMEETVNADRIIVMEGGHIALDGKPCEVFTKVEEMHSLGLSVPTTTEVMFELNKCGFNLPLEAFSPEECAKEIARELG